MSSSSSSRGPYFWPVRTRALPAWLCLSPAGVCKVSTYLMVTGDCTVLLDQLYHRLDQGIPTQGALSVIKRALSGHLGMGDRVRRGIP